LALVLTDIGVLRIAKKRLTNLSTFTIIRERSRQSTLIENRQ